MNNSVNYSLIVSNAILICIEIILIVFIKLSFISSNFGLEVSLNYIFYLSIIGIQIILTYLIYKLKNDRNQRSLLISLLLIFPILFILILNELNVI